MTRIPIIILYFISLITFKTFAQDSLSAQKPINKKISYLNDSSHWSIEVPLWIPGFRGEFASGDIELIGEPSNLPENPGFGDAFARFFKTKFGVNYFFMTSVSYKYEKFYAEFEMFSGTLGSDTEFRYNSKTLVDASIHADLMRLSAAYNIYENLLFNNKARYRLYAYGGVRMHYVKVSSDLDRIGYRLKLDPFWAEPLVGLRNQVELNYWNFLFQFDMGSFGIDNKFSYMLNFYSYYRLSNLLSLKIGWNDLFLNYEFYKNEEKKIKLHIAGPVAAIIFEF